MDGIPLPASLKLLAALLGEALGGPLATPIEIDKSLVDLALRRHFVGPLLYAVAEKGRHAIADAQLEKLKQTYLLNAARQRSALDVLHKIAADFGARGIEWMTIKGATQAAQLYPDPAWRDSADIDLLVPPREFSRAVDALIGLDFIASNPPMPRSGVFRQPILNAVRDVTFIARNDRTCAVELHRRLFFASGKRAALRLETAPGILPMPQIGSELAFYLIAHGALSFWVRLKWLIDLVPLFAQLSDAEKLGIVERARFARAENSVAASLSLLRALFPFVSLGGLYSWLEQKEKEASVKRRLARYADMIGRDRDWKLSPLDNALIALHANWLVFEAPSARARILMSAAPSSLARKIAGSLMKTDRALTQSDEPPPLR
jgi:hypothetical protein